MRLAQVRVEQAQVIVDFGGGRNDRPRAGAGTALLNGDRRRQPFDEVHVGLAHLIQKLPGVGGQRLHVLALAFGVNGIEGQ